MSRHFPVDVCAVGGAVSKQSCGSKALGMLCDLLSNCVISTVTNLIQTAKRSFGIHFTTDLYFFVPLKVSVDGQV